MIQKVKRREEVSSFLSSEKKYVVVLECGHELELAAPDPDSSEFDCLECGPEAGPGVRRGDWSYALSISLFLAGERVYTLDLPAAVGDDEEGEFPIVQAHMAELKDSINFDGIKVEMKFRHDE